MVLAAAPIQLSTAPSNPNELRITGLGGGSSQWTIVILMTFLTLIPSMLICMTPFARLLIVFHFLRQALGLQTTPSNQTLIGLSVIMTFFLMQPVGEVIYRDSIIPLQQGKITAIDAVTRGAIPMRQFMSHFVRERDVALFLEMAKEPRPENIGDVSFRVLLPAYILSELKAGLSDWRRPLFAFSCRGHGRRVDYHFCRHDAVAARGHFYSVEAAAVSHGRRLASSDRRFDEEFQLMGVDQVVLLARLMLQEVVILVGPVLAVAIVVSLVVNILQVLTSLQDQTLSQVPRLLVTGAALFLLMPWMWRHLAHYTINLLTDFHQVLQ